MCNGTAVHGEILADPDEARYIDTSRMRWHSRLRLWER
jgi:hypothetical protein